MRKIHKYIYELLLFRGGAGDWASDGCELYNVTHSHIVCHCYHLTNFAVLMTISPQASEMISVCVSSNIK